MSYGLNSSSNCFVLGKVWENKKRERQMFLGIFQLIFRKDYTILKDLSSSEIFLVVSVLFFTNKKKEGLFTH